MYSLSHLLLLASVNFTKISHALMMVIKHIKRFSHSPKKNLGFINVSSITEYINPMHSLDLSVLFMQDVS